MENNTEKQDDLVELTRGEVINHVEIKKGNVIRLVKDTQKELPLEEGKKYWIYDEDEENFYFEQEKGPCLEASKKSVEKFSSDSYFKIIK